MGNMMLLVKINTSEKISIIQALRELGQMGLKEAKDAVEHGLIMNNEQLLPFMCALWTRQGEVKGTNHGFSYTLNIDIYQPVPQPVRWTTPVIKHTNAW